MGESRPHTASAKPQTSSQDVSLRPIITFAAVLVGVTGLVLLGMSWLFTSVTTRQARLDTPPSPLAQTVSPLPPGPRLQVKPAQDLRQMRAEEDAILHSYGWVDQSTGTVRIPLARALELIVERGLPSRAATQSTPHIGSQGTP